MSSRSNHCRHCMIFVSRSACPWRCSLYESASIQLHWLSFRCRLSLSFSSLPLLSTRQSVLKGQPVSMFYFLLKVFFLFPFDYWFQRILYLLRHKKRNWIIRKKNFYPDSWFFFATKVWRLDKKGTPCRPSSSSSQVNPDVILCFNSVSTKVMKLKANFSDVSSQSILLLIFTSLVSGKEIRERRSVSSRILRSWLESLEEEVVE